MDDDLADPANGEDVPRCAVCGVPGTKGNKIIPGRWGYIRWNMDLRLCERCVRGHMERERADPLTLDDTG